MTRRWSLTVFDDGSAVSLCEWRGDYEYRDHIPATAEVGEWRCCEFGFDKDEAVPRELAISLLKAWKACRTRGSAGGWMDL